MDNLLRDILAKLQLDQDSCETKPLRKEGETHFWSIEGEGQNGIEERYIIYDCSGADSTFDFGEYQKIMENEEGISTLLDNVTKAASSNEILREVLGISSTFPLWASSKINILIKNTISQGISEKSLSDFRNQMENLGFGNVIPTALNQLFEGDKND